MYLKALEIQGFKSFPDKTVLSFGTGITGVVGPNGSGKSNISDAVRWVLGEQSTKSLRGSKMEDVIFSGTSSRRALGFAEVTLRLDNSDGALNHPDKEISVTRRYYRSGESAYLINSKSVRLRDVNELFMDTGLGRDGYSMVSQGKVDELVSAKSENRRDMFEEAAGISHYRYRRADANKRLNQTEENLVRLRDIVGELASRVGPLEKQSIKAQQFLLLAAERKELQIGLWLRTLENSAGQIREQANKLDVARAQYDGVVNELMRLSEIIDGSADEIREINVNIENIRSKNVKTEEQASALDSDAAVYENSILHNNENADRVKRDILLQDESIEHTENEKNAVLQRIKELDGVIEDLKNRLMSLTNEMAGLKSRDEEYSDEYNQKNSALANIASLIANAQIEKSAALSSVEEINNRALDIRAAIEKRKETAKELEERKKTQETELQNAVNGLQSLSNMRSGVGLKLKKSEERLADKKAACEARQLELLSAKQRLKFLQDTEKNMEGYQGSVKAVMREKSHGTLRGIRGTVFQLITVPSQYTTAIETALGGAVQNIVTETENDAKRAINTLKNLNAGRATFLPMNAVKGRTLDEKGLDDQFGFVGIASELISYDPEYDNIVKSLLGRTAVAEDLDTAVIIAKKFNYRFKIVTLDGQVINAGGSMTGGSKINSAGFFTRKSEAEALQKQTEKLSVELEMANAEVKTAAEAASAERARYDGISAEIIEGSEVKTSAESALALTVSVINENTSVLTELLSELKANEKRTAGLNSAIENAENKLKELEKQRLTAENELSVLTGGHDEMLSERERINDALSEVNMNIASCLQERQAKEEQAADFDKRRGEMKSRRVQLENELGEIDAKNAELTKNLEAAKGAARALRDQIAENNRSIGKLIEKREQTEKAQVEARDAEKAKNDEKERLGAETVRLEERRLTLEREEEETERKLYEEYSLTRREASEIAKPIENAPAANKRLSELRAQIKALGNVNVAAIDEYKEVSQRYEFLSKQVEDVEKSKKELLKMIDELTQKMSELFLDRFNAINNAFKQTFTELFLGGSAELTLEDENDILECGINIKAQPPGKNVKNISLLSGGEKGLTAVALLFAILKVRPAPFCIFDEVEAALDDVNVGRYAQYVRMMTANTQFILITHRRGTMEEADILYGVTMSEHGVSKLLELNTAQLVEELQLEE
ncbi:MAG: chromosome segregation protein SMC [Oscillospiraceae bacterium]|nr:chromosome segregation protein SMC [Oscillospiraceae bacterium]